MQTCDPLRARQQFKFMVCMNWLIAIGVFIPMVFILQMFLPLLFADAIAIASIFCLFFYFLRKRTIVLQCPQCGNYIETNTPWKCGACGKTNLRVYDFPFVRHCENEQCRCEPKAYKCHHRGCGAFIFFSLDKSVLNCASSSTEPERAAPQAPRVEKKKVMSEEEQFAREVVKRQRNIKLKDLDVDEAVLDVKLQELNRTLKPQSLKSLKDRLRSGVFNKSELDDEVQKMKAEADKEFAGDEDARRRRHAVIDAEARDLL